MAAGDQADQQALDHRFLPDDHLPGLGEERIDEGGFLLDAVVEEPDVGRWLCGHGCSFLPGARRLTEKQPAGQKLPAVRNARRRRLPRILPMPLR